MYIPHKQFSTQGLVISQTRPIIIDTDQQYHQTKPLTSVATISKLPAFQPDDKITKILYSKFLVKGVKPINSDIMLSKLRGINQKKGESKSKKNNSPHVRRQRIVTDLNSSHNKLKIDRPQQKQKGVFQFTIDHHDKFSNRNRPQTAFQRSQSLNHLNRPQSAAINHSNSQRRLTRPTSVERSGTKNRSMTAISRTNSVKNHLNNRFQMAQENENIRPILTITDDFNNLKSINYVEKNRREASIKKQNTYITDVQIANKSQTKAHQKQGHSKQAKNVNNNHLKNTQRQTVTAKQKLRIKQKHIEYLNYLKDNEPEQYSQCINYLISLDQNGNKLEKSIIGMAFEEQDDFLPSKRQVQEEQVKGFYQNFYNICTDGEYGIKKAQRKMKVPQKSSNLLNIYECQQLLELYKEIQQHKIYNSEYSCKTERIRQIIKNLSFFKDLKPQIVKNMLDMNFKIQLIDQDKEMIKEDADIVSVYIILNGSVSRKNKQEEDLIDFNKNKMPEFYTTLFDGQVFGLPSKPQQKTLKYSIRTLQRCLLMMFPYQSYRKALSSNQNIEDRIQLLKDFLPTGKANSKLSKQDYQIIAFQMESNTFSAQDAIYRQGQHCQKLIMIASGKAAVCFQSVLTRKKLDVDPLKKTRNQITPAKLKIKDFRRKNLKNYEVIQENAESVTYYYSQLIEQKIRGDVLNLQGFYNKMLPVYIEDNDFVHTLTYSLVSIHDNTKIYQLAPQKTETFPQHIKNALFEKAESQRNQKHYKRNLKEANKWQNFKQNLVQSILNQKQKR